MKEVIAFLLLFGLCAEISRSSSHRKTSEANQTSTTIDDHGSLNEQAHDQSKENQQDGLCLRNVTVKNNNFGFNLYRQIADKHDNNVFFSPLCVSTALASLLLASKGVTHEQILQGLNLEILQDDKKPNLVPALFKRLKDVIGKNDDLILDQGSFSFIHESFPIKESFLNLTREYFDMEVGTIDFHNSTNAKNLINQYISKMTKGKIPQLYDSLDPQTKLVLLSYIVFKGKWLYPFNEAFTELNTFYINTYNSVKVPMMYKTDKIFSMVDKKFGCTVAKLPYRGKATMLVVLPEEGVDYGSIEDHLTSELVETWLTKMESRKMDVFFPKFKLDHKYEMAQLLQELGIREVFSGGGNLTGLSDERNLRLSQVTQRAVIEVDERGTEASAVTGSEIIAYSLPATIRVERPFLFLIYEERLNTLLFIGRVVNPMEQ